jgi:hypothetical protein
MIRLPSISNSGQASAVVSADVLVPEIGLQRSRIDALVCELVAGGMTQHVGMDWKRHFLIPAEPFHHAPEADGAHGCFALAHEHVTAGLLLTL